MAIERTDDLAQRAASHAALADPGRLLVVDALTLGDRSPGELALELGMSSNLLAHHLNVLESAGLVRRLRSESDGRRTYLRLDQESMHRIARAPDRAVPLGRVVFVCTANSARSQLAAAAWAERAGPAASAGTHPADRIHPGAVRAARKFGLQLQAEHPASVTEVARPDDTLVTVCDSADREVFQPHLHWSVPDPVPAGTQRAFDRTMRQLLDRIEVWLSPSPIR